MAVVPARSLDRLPQLMCGICSTTSPHVDSGPRPQGHLLFAYRGASDRDRDQTKQIKKKPPRCGAIRMCFLVCLVRCECDSALPEIEIIITA
jgi:hypothetical protein